MKRLVVTGLILAGVGAAAAAHAEQLREGASACRVHRALVDLRAAQRAGDQRTIDWLYGGAACIRLEAATEVSVIAGTEDGARRLRTLNRPRNIELWVSAEEVEPI